MKSFNTYFIIAIRDPVESEEVFDQHFSKRAGQAAYLHLYLHFIVLLVECVLHFLWPFLHACQLWFHGHSSCIRLSSEFLFLESKLPCGIVSILKPSQNKKGQKNFQLHPFLNSFSELPAVKKYSKKRCSWNFGPSYFDPALVICP